MYIIFQVPKANSGKTSVATICHSARATSEEQFCLPQFQLLTASWGLKLMTPLWHFIKRSRGTQCYVTVSISHSHCISSHRHCIISPSQEGRVQDNKIFWEKDHTHINYYSILLYLFFLLSVIAVNLLLWLIYKLNLSKVCMYRIKQYI